MRNISTSLRNRAVPRTVKEAVSQLDGLAYRVIVAPFISDASAKICEISGVGYCDLSGNCLIQTDSIYISNKGNPNQYPVKNHAKTIFKSSAKTTSLILRELMKDVSKRWKLKELAEEVGCSIGMYGGTQKKKKSQHIQGVKALKATGGNFAFAFDPQTVRIEAERTDGAMDVARVNVIAVVPYFVMKASAMGRGKAKDAYDLYFLIKHYQAGVDGLVKLFEDYKDSNIVLEMKEKRETKH